MNNRNTIFLIAALFIAAAVGVLIYFYTRNKIDLTVTGNIVTYKVSSGFSSITGTVDKSTGIPETSVIVGSSTFVYKTNSLKFAGVLIDKNGKTTAIKSVDNFGKITNTNIFDL